MWLPELRLVSTLRVDKVVVRNIVSLWMHILIRNGLHSVASVMLIRRMWLNIDPSNRWSLIPICMINGGSRRPCNMAEILNMLQLPWIWNRWVKRLVVLLIYGKIRAQSDLNTVKNLTVNYSHFNETFTTFTWLLRNLQCCCMESTKTKHSLITDISLILTFEQLL